MGPVETNLTDQQGKKSDMSEKAGGKRSSQLRRCYHLISRCLRIFLCCLWLTGNNAAMRKAAIGVEQERSHAWGVQQAQDPGRSKDSFSRRLCRMIRNRLRLRLRIRILLLLLRQGSRVLTQDKTRYTRIMKPLGDGCMSFEMHHHSSSTRLESPLFSAYGPAGVFCWKVGTNWVGSQREDQLLLRTTCWFVQHRSSS